MKKNIVVEMNKVLPVNDKFIVDLLNADTLNAFCNRFICGDCEKILKTMPDSSIDLVLTSPPYADKRDYGGIIGTIPPDEYVDWFLPKAREIYRVLKDDGSFVLNISDKIVNNYQHLYAFQQFTTFEP